MKQVLITGGAGFIGSHLAEVLLARGHRVIALDDESSGSPDNLAGVRDHFDFSYVTGSVTDAPLLRDVLRDVDEVYHLAAAVGVKLLADAPLESIERNVQPAEVLLAELRKRMEERHVVKLFVASSSEVYGKNPNSPFSETDDLVLGPTTQMRWSYGASKALDEFLALATWRQHRLPVVVGRLFNVVGPRQSGRYGMVLPRFVEQALAGRPPVVHDDGKQVRCFAHVVDVCRAIADLMEVESAVGEVINIGDDQPITILELAERVVEIVSPQLDIEFESYRHAYGEDFEDVRSRIPDLTKLRRIIRYAPQYNLDATLRETIDWMRSQAK